MEEDSLLQQATSIQIIFTTIVHDSATDSVHNFKGNHQTFLYFFFVIFTSASSMILLIKALFFFWSSRDEKGKTTSTQVSYLLLSFTLPPLTFIDYLFGSHSRWQMDRIHEDALCISVRYYRIPANRPHFLLGKCPPPGSHLCDFSPFTHSRGEQEGTGAERIHWW